MILRLLHIGCLLCFLAPAVSAQWTVSRFTVSNTGVWSAGGSYRLLATTGQAAVGRVSWADHGFWPIVSAPISVDHEDIADVPQSFALYGNYPNPFNPSTTLRFDLSESSEMRVEVVDVLGRSVMTTSPVRMAAGPGRTLVVDARSLPSGTYTYRLTAGGATRTHVATGRFVLVK